MEGMICAKEDIEGHTWIAVRFHQFLYHLLVVRSAVSSAARNDRQLVEPSVSFLFIGQK